MFLIFCTTCNGERFALKHTRKRVYGDDRIYGVNKCLSCGSLYDAPAPKEGNGGRGSAVHKMAPQAKLL